MSMLLGVIALFAILSACIAAVQAVAISRLTPAAGWRDWMFGWWRFAEISQRAGLSGEEHAAAYKRAVIAAFSFVILGLILSGWVVNERPSGAATANPKKYTGWRIETVAMKPNSLLRPVAPMPGAFLLES